MPWTIETILLPERIIILKSFTPISQLYSLDTTILGLDLRGSLIFNVSSYLSTYSLILNVILLFESL